MSKSSIVFLAILCSVATAQGAPPNSAVPTDPTDQIIIQAQREKLSVLRAQIANLEDQLFVDYNKLNSIRQYDIVCTTNTPTGNHFQYRECQAVFVHNAQQEEAQDFLYRISGGQLGHPAAPANLVIAGKLPDYQKNFRAVVKASPELRKLVVDRAALVSHFEAVRKQKFKGRFIVWD